MIGQNAPTNPLQGFVDDLAKMRGRIADLERFLSRPAPRGIVGLTEATATAWTNATGTETDITVSAGTAPQLTLALSPARKYRAKFQGRFSGSVASDIIVRFYESGTARMAAVAAVPAAPAVTVFDEWVFTPASASSVVYKVMGALAAGAPAATISATASAATPMQFWIEDIGPA